MEKTCILFVGQGSQYEGMGSELISIFPELSSIYECASDILGYDLEKTCFLESAEVLSRTEVTQPAIMATSLVAYEAVKKIGIVAQAAAGHSLGEYAAMVASGILSMEDGFKVIKERAKAMSECAAGQDGMMCAVLGMTAEDITAICQSIDGYVIPVNYNSPAQTVIAGECKAVEAAMEKFSELGKKAVKLAVSAAFHSKLMQSGADAFYNAIKATSFNAPSIDFYSNVIGAKMTDFSDMATYLKTHLVSPVQFVNELKALQADGFTNFIECGPNKVLTGLVKKTLSGATALNIENEKTFNKLKGE